MSSIAHLSSAHPRDDSRIFFKQCMGLIRNNFKVNLIVADGLGQERVDGINILDVGMPSGRVNRAVVKTNRIFRAALALNSDLYHLHDPELLPVGLALKRHGKRVIFDSHEDVPIQILSKPYLTPRILSYISSCYSLFENFSCSRFDGIIAATPFIRDKFLKINDRTIDICNYPIISEFMSCNDWIQKKNEVCYVGGVSSVRGARELITALAEVPSSIRLNLVGEISDPGFLSTLMGLPSWSRVDKWGILDRGGVREIYRRSLVGLVTLHPIRNYIDALPIKMFEYMSAGIPVVASSFPLWKKIVLGNNCGLCVDPLNPNEIASAITYLVSNPKEAMAMGDNGRRLVENQFNWQNEEVKLLKFYEHILSLKNRN